MQNTKSLKEIITGSIKKNMRQSTMIIALISIWIIFSFLTEFIFLTPRNMTNLFVQTAVTSILAISMVMIIVTGHIDLSVGSVMGFLGAVSALLMIKLNLNPILVILFTILTGALIGAWHGFWIAYKKVPAFIVTLASMLGFRGAIIGITGGQTQGLEMASQKISQVFKIIGQDYLFRITPDFPIHETTLILALITIIFYNFFEIKKRNARISYGLTVLPNNIQYLKMLLMSLIIFGFFLVMAVYLGVPYSLILAVVLALILNFVAKNTTFGRHLYAIGGNTEAARLSGINIELKTFMLFILNGVMVSIAGIVYTSRLFAATTSAGQNAELDAIASAVIGGTSLMGGEGTIIGALIGALVMGSLDNGMSLMNLDITYQYIIKGLILLFAVWVDINNRKQGK